MNQMQQLKFVTPSLDGNVLTLTLGNAPAHPLSLGMIEALQQTFDTAAADPDVHVIILHGPGRIFCAGHDLKEIARHRADADNGLAYLRQLFAACADLMQTITASPKPTVAVVEGIATAAGLQLVAACDLAYATPQARFQLPGVTNNGFCTTPAVTVGRSIARKHVMELALSGEPFNADWALAAGLINRILPEAQLTPFVQDFARKLAGRHQPAVSLGKQTLHRQLDMTTADAYAHATEVMIAHFLDPARMAKEKARWGRD